MNDAYEIENNGIDGEDDMGSLNHKYWSTSFKVFCRVDTLRFIHPTKNP